VDAFISLFGHSAFITVGNPSVGNLNFHDGFVYIQMYKVMDENALTERVRWVTLIE